MNQLIQSIIYTFIFLVITILSHNAFAAKPEKSEKPETKCVQEFGSQENKEASDEEDEYEIDEAEILEDTAGFERNSLRQYLKTISKFPLLSREGENIIGKSIQDRGDEFRAAVFESDFVLHEVIKTLTRIKNRDIKIHGPISVSNSQVDKSNGVREAIEQNFTSLKTKRSEHKKLFLEAIKPSNSLNERQEAWKKLTKSRRETYVMMQPFLLRIKTLEDIYKRLIRINFHMQRIYNLIQEAKATDPNNESDEYKKLKIKLALIMRSANESPATLAKKVQRLKKLHSAYFNKRNKFSNSNLRLVVSIAKKHRHKTIMPFLDLIQQGNFGLMRATEDFDPDSGNKFSTYATPWIFNAIMEAIRENRAITHIPIEKQKKAFELMAIEEEKLKLNQTQLSFEELLFEKKRRDLVKKLEREPTEDEIKNAFDKITSREFQSIRNALSLVKGTASLNVMAGNSQSDDGTELVNFIEGDNNPVSTDTTEKELKSVIETAFLDDLNERQAAVVRLRLGFEDGNTYTLEEVGKIVGVTRERVRQLEQEAFKKLHYNRELNGLSAFNPVIDED